MIAKQKKTKKKDTHSGVEKPVSLWGAPFTEVVAALLKTKPMSKEEKEQEDRSQNDKIKI